MTPEGFKAWRQHLRLSKIKAARELGRTAATIAAYERGTTHHTPPRPAPIPRAIELACAALALGITRYDGPPAENAGG